MNEKDRSTWPIDAVHNVTVIQSSGVSSKVTLYNLKRTDTGAYIAIGKYKDREDFAYFRLQVFGKVKTFPNIFTIIISIIIIKIVIIIIITIIIIIIIIIITIIVIITVFVSWISFKHIH